MFKKINFQDNICLEMHDMFKVTHIGKCLKKK